ncbi:STAS domain-containing protein [Granulosicoccaceae sp. 1_MG-2023]|nr:STAS domain-containing protein [Granulosicoccaceae sp. 1_MG-2023]
MAASVASLKKIDESRFALGGTLDFDSVPGILTESARVFPRSGNYSVDLAAVDSANSALMALLIEWQAQAGKHGQTLSIEHVPEHIVRLAGVCKAESVIGL